MAATVLADPILYEHASDDTTKNGLGHVPGLLSSSVAGNYDQVPQITLVYDYSTKAAGMLQKDRVLMVDAGPDWQHQLFRIDNIDTEWTSEGRNITVIATHIGGDLFGDVTTADVSLANSNPTQTWADFFGKLAEPLPVTMTSSITDVAIVSWPLESIQSAQDVMFGRDNHNPSFTSLYDAEWWFDNYNFSLEHHVGRDTGIVIKYGHHMTGLHNTDNIEGIYTAVRPFSKYTPGQSGGKGDDSNIHQVTGIGLIQYAGNGSLPMYDSPWDGHNMLATKLTNGTRFQVYSYANTGTALGHTWYNLGGKQWVDGNYLSFEKGKTSLVDTNAVGNTAVGIGTVGYNLDNTESKQIIETLDGVLTVQYVGPGKVAIWDSPFAPHSTTGEYLANGNAYRAYKKATDANGHVWYNLGGNQWIDGQYVSLEKGRDYAASKTRGIGTIKYDGKGGVAVYREPTYDGAMTGRYLKNGTQWQIYGTASNGSTTWYNLGGDQWVDSQYITFEHPTDVEPPDTSDDTSTDDQKAPSIAWSYDKPGDWNTKVHEYHSGDQVHIFGQGNAGGTTWYNIGTNEWILADDLTFDGDTDVDPSGAADDMGEQVAQVTVTLPEKYIAVPMPNGQQYEHQHIETFDASEYGVTNEDDLRAITKAFISDNQIGQPQVSMTIDYIDDGHFDYLKNVRLYDRVTVFIPDLNINITAEVTATVYDTLLQRNTTVTIGTRPQTITDDLDHWKDQATKDLADSNANNSQKIDDIDLAWHKAIDQTNKDVADGQKRTTEQQTEWETEFKQTIDEDINNYKQTIADQVAEVNKLSSIIKYNNNEIDFYNGSGTQVGEMGAGGLVYYDASGNPTTVVSADGKVIANSIAGNLLTGTTIHGAEIDGGTVTALDYFSATSAGGTTVISGDWGLSTDSGINIGAGTYSDFHGAVTFESTTNFHDLADFANGISVDAGGSSYISFSNGCYLYAGAGDTIAIHDGHGSHTL